jgi:hypothetical protein
VLLAPEQVPGFVAFITAADIPTGGSRDVFGDALFATDFAAYAGQRIGLAVASSQVSTCCSHHQALLACCMMGSNKEPESHAWVASEPGGSSGGRSSDNLGCSRVGPAPQREGALAPAARSCYL